MIEIREVTISDADAVAAISSNELGYKCSKELVEKRISNLDHAKQKVFVAVDESKVIGFVQAEIYELLYQEDQVNILGLAVQKSSQRKGVGRCLIERVESWANEMNAEKVRVNSALKRNDAHKFYESLGYKNTKEQKRFEKNSRQLI